MLNVCLLGPMGSTFLLEPGRIGSFCHGGGQDTWVLGPSKVHSSDGSIFFEKNKASSKSTLKCTGNVKKPETYSALMRPKIPTNLGGDELARYLSARVDNQGWLLCLIITENRNTFLLL